MRSPLTPVFPSFATAFVCLQDDPEVEGIPAQTESSARSPRVGTFQFTLTRKKHDNWKSLVRKMKNRVKKTEDVCTCVAIQKVMLRVFLLYPLGWPLHVFLGLGRRTYASYAPRTVVAAALHGS